MKDMDLHVGIMVKDCIVTVKIFEQPEYLRGKGRLASIVLDDFRVFSLLSEFYPHLTYVSLYIRGTGAASDNIPIKRVYGTHHEALIIANAIADVVRMAGGIAIKL